MPVHREPSRCPKCDKKENIVEVCKHCGYEYEEESLTGWDILIGIFVAWVILTIGYWILQSVDYPYGTEPKALWEVLKSQWRAITSLKIF